MRYGIVALVPLAALLSACWQSDQQLILADDAVPAPVGGNWSYSASDGTHQSVTVKADRDNYYRFHAESPGADATDSQLRFYPVSGAWYLVQSQSITDGFASQMSEYRLVRISSGKVEEYEPSCTSADANYPGISFDSGDCTFSDFAGLRARALIHVAAFDSGDSSALDYAGTYTK